MFQGAQLDFGIFAFLFRMVGSSRIHSSICYDLCVYEYEIEFHPVMRGRTETGIGMKSSPFASSE